jgi:hypothetical protein
VESCGLDSSGSGQSTVVDCCEHGSEPSGSIEGGEFLDWLRTLPHGVRCSVQCFTMTSVWTDDDFFMSLTGCCHVALRQKYSSRRNSARGSGSVKKSF